MSIAETREMVRGVKQGWVWLPDWEAAKEQEPYFVCFRKRISLHQVPEKADLKISADSRYKLYINGKFVEAGPCKGDDKIWYYDELDISPYLSDGDNVIAVYVLRYPAIHGKGNFGVFRTATPGLFVACKQLQLGTDNTWKCKVDSTRRIVSENPYYAPLQIYETVDGSKESASWMNCEFADEQWEDAQVYNREILTEVLREEKLATRPIPFMQRIPRTFRGISKVVSSAKTSKEWEEFLEGNAFLIIPPHTQECVELDAGELMTGFLRLELAGGCNAQIEILQSECYAGELMDSKDPFQIMPRKKKRDDSANGKLYGYTDVYGVAGEGTEEVPEIYEPFWFRTFRYIRLTVKTEEIPLVLCRFHYEETGYPLEVKAKVEVSDSSLQKIWDISLRTLKRCMHETYVDCPFYEQLQYVMDSRSQILYTYAISRDDRLAKKCMNDFARSVRPDGMINGCYPNYETNVIPGFAIYYIGMLYDHMIYFKEQEFEKEFLKKHLEVMDGILSYFERNLDERSLVGKIGGLNGSGQYWSFIDWTWEWDETTGVPPATLQGPITMESLLYLLGLQYASEIAVYMDWEELAEKYKERAARVREAVNRYCVGQNGMYQDGPGVDSYSQHSQVFAILTETVSVEQGRIILQETLRNKEKYAQCSVAMMFYLFRALEKSGLYEETDALWDIWREMVENHLTTCAEDSMRSRSDCHAWGALALYELPTVVLGVRPTESDAGEPVISPCAGKLQWAKGEVPTAHGLVKVEWSREGEDISWKRFHKSLDDFT